MASALYRDCYAPSQASPTRIGDRIKGKNIKLGACIALKTGYNLFSFSRPHRPLAVLEVSSCRNFSPPS